MPELFPYSAAMARRKETSSTAPEFINANRPHLWKADIALSVDQFNQWFMRFAPEAFRSTRVKTTQQVKAALIATRDLHNIDCATLQASGLDQDTPDVYCPAARGGPVDRACRG